MNEPEDLFDTEDFKSLPIHKRIWIRVVVAFWLTIGC
jgi:hypothetical protein